MSNREYGKAFKIKDRKGTTVYSLHLFKRVVSDIKLCLLTLNNDSIQALGFSW